MLGAGKKITIGTTDIVDADSKIDWDILKNTPFLYTAPAQSALPTTQDQYLGDLTFNWADGNDVVSIQALSGTDTAGQDDGYALFQTRASTDSALVTRLRVDKDITAYSRILPGTTGTVDIG